MIINEWCTVDDYNPQNILYVIYLADALNQCAFSRSRTESKNITEELNIKDLALGLNRESL